MGSPAVSPQQIVDVPLSLFGGIHTGVAPPDLPEGLSPDNQDVAFVPGELFSRPCLSRIFAAPTVPGSGVAMMYNKTYILPNGDPLTLFMDANGVLYVEDVGNLPGLFSTLAQVSAGISAISASAFGREYIALSDLLHGKWCPLQYDGQFLDRVTQDGPGFSPICQNVAPATAAIANSGAGASYTIATVVSSDPVVYGGQTSYSTLTIVTTAPNAIASSSIVTITGVTGTLIFGYVGPVQTIVNATTFKISIISVGTQSGTGGTVQLQLPTLIRNSNIVTATTSAAHGFKVGSQVSVSGIANNNIGGGIASIARDGNGVVTVVTTNANGLVIQSNIQISGVSNPNGSFNGNFSVASVLSPTSFTYQQGGVSESSSAGSGNVQDIWNIVTFIQSIPSPTTFTYQDIGPNDISNGTGTAAIIGQISPGPHGIAVSYLTRNGAITKPSPPVTFYANGGQQLSLTGLPIGPSDVVARVIIATGAGGDNYFTIPAVPQVGGQIVGTSLIIEDNTSTAVIIDFADNTLFDGVAVDQVGNDLFDQRVLFAPIGFYSYGSRLFCWGDFNAIQNLLNMTLAAGTDLFVVAATAGSGANGGALGTSWTNPGNVVNTATFADVNLTPGNSSKALLCEAFGFAITANATQIQVSFNYYWTGGAAFGSRLSFVLLKAGVVFGSAQSVQLLAGGGGGPTSPLSATLTFPVGTLTPADINGATFGVQAAGFAGSLAGVHIFTNNVNLSISTSTGLPQGWKSTGSTSLTGLTIASTFPGMYTQYQMTSGGGTNDCMIVQPCYQDAFGTAILQPSTNYWWRVFVKAPAGITGAVVADFFSPSLGLLASATVSLAIVSAPGFQIAVFSAETPATIPTDVTLRIYLQNVTAGSVLAIGEMCLPFAQNPYTGNIALVSYVLNPEGIAQTTGLLGSADDPSDVRCFSVQRNSTLLKTAAGTHIFQSNDFEPDQWVVDNLSRSVGSCSIRGGDPGQFGTGDAAEDWDVTVNQNGMYLFAGGDFWKISQELDPGDPSNPVLNWSNINWAAQQTICVKNDPKKHRIYILAPVNGATQPNVIWVVDYKELDTASDLANGPSLKIGITGKMLSTDKTRKWTRWNIAANCADILVRPGNDREMTFAGGTQDGQAYSNLYTLDSTKLTDDDYGQMFPYYTTYGFVNHEQEQMLGLGTDRKLIRKYCAFITGTGYVTITPLVNSLQNPLPATTPRILMPDSNPSNLQNTDLEWTVGVRGERIFQRISVFPLPGSTDVQFKVQKLIVHMMKDAVVIHRGSGI